MTIALQNLLKNSVQFGHFQFYAGQFDGLNQPVTLSGLQKANKNFQPNLGSGQTAQIDLDFNKSKTSDKVAEKQDKQAEKRKEKRHSNLSPYPT